MSKRRMWQDWLPPVQIPEGTSGALRIRHLVREPGWRAPLATMRTAFFGDSWEAPTFPIETRWHELSEEDRGVWTTDLPIERVQQERDVKSFRGDVLVSGLGVGLIATILLRKKLVNSVTVVERSVDVGALVVPYLDKRIRVIHADVFDYLAETDEHFDYVFHDIWQSDSLHTFRHTVLPLRKASRRVLRKPREDGKRVANWNEGVMLGQLALQLRYEIMAIDNPDIRGLTGITDEDLDHPDLCLTAPFIKWVRRTKPSSEWADAVMRGTYLPEFGSTKWERRWGELQHCGRQKIFE